MSNTWLDVVRSLMTVDPSNHASATDALTSQCLTEQDLELLRSQLGQLLSVDRESVAITVLLECELGLVVAVMQS